MEKYFLNFIVNVCSLLTVLCFYVARLQEFRSALYAVFSSEHSQSLAVSRVTVAVNETNTRPFSAGEIETAFQRMEEANQIMVSEGMIFLI